MLNFLKKHWFIIIILFLSLIRFLFTYKLPTFFLSSSAYDDALMINYYDCLVAGKYLGLFNKKTLIKGPMCWFYFIIYFIFYIFCFIFKKDN